MNKAYFYCLQFNFKKIHMMPLFHSRVIMNSNKPKGLKVAKKRPDV